MSQILLKEKAIKDLELMAKKLKKRIAVLEAMPLGNGHIDYSSQISILMAEYRMLKRDIVDIASKI